MVKGTDYTIDENNVMHSTKWIPITFEFKETGTYDIYVDGEKQATDFGMASAWGDSLTKFVIAKRNAKSVTDAETYVDNFKIEQCVYFTDELTEINDVALSDIEVDKEQTLDYDLTMSNGTTKTVQVKFTPTAEATSVVGKIDGFDDVTVNYKLLAEKDETINATAGTAVELADGSTVTPTTIGRLTRTVSTDTEIINYTINVSGYAVKYSDDMEGHTNTPYTGTTSSYTTISPKTNEDFQLKMSNGGEYSAIIDEGTNGQYVLFERNGSKNRTLDKHMRWTVANGSIGEKYSISAKFKAEDFSAASQRPISFEFYNVNNKPITHNIVLQSDNAAGTAVSLRATTESTHTNKTTFTTATITADKYNVTYANKGLDWFDLRVDFDTTAETYSIYINDVLFEGNIGYANPDETDNSLGSIVLEDRTSTSFDGKIYFDDLRVSVIDSFAADYELPEASATVAKGAEAPLTTTMELTTANGLKVYPTVTYSVDTSKFGKVTDAAATVAGFTDTTTVKATVLGYDVAVADGNVAVTSLGANDEATAIVAYYSKNGEEDVFIKANMVTVNAAAAGTVQNIPLETVENAATIKVFIVNDTTNVQPVHIATSEPLA